MNKFSSSLLHGLTAFLFITIVFVCTSCVPEDPPIDEDPPIVNDVDCDIFKVKTNVVYSRLSAEPDRINPLLSTSSYSRPIWEQIFLSPLDINPQTLALDPVLASSRPEVTEITEGPYTGGLVYAFDLRPEAKWSDGKPVTVEDILFSFKILFNPAIPADAHRAFFEMVKDVQTDPANKNRYKVITDKQYILAEAAIGSLNIFPAHVFDPEGLLSSFSVVDLIEGGGNIEDERLGEFATLFQSTPYSRDKDKLVGSGPYTFESWEAGQYLVIDRQEDWWGDDLQNLRALPDSIVFRIVSDQAAAINGLKDEMLDVAFQIDSKAYVELKDNEFAKTHLNLHSPAALQYSYVAFNTKDPLLEDKRVRRAMAHLLDVDQIIEKLYSGLGTRVTTSIHPSKPYVDKSLQPIPYDVDKAISLLKEAGWEDSNGDGVVDKEINGTVTEMKLDYLLTPGSAFAKGLSELLKSNALQAGIEVNIVPIEFQNMMLEHVYPRKFQLFSLGAGADPLLDDFRQGWHTSSNTASGGNRTQFGTAETDALIEEINLTMDENKRNALYKQFQGILYDEQPMIFLFAPQERIAISKRFDAKSSVVRPGYDIKSFDYRCD